MTRDGIHRRRVMALLSTWCAVGTLALAAPGTATASAQLSRPATAPTSLTAVGWVTGTVVDEKGTPVVGDLVSAIGPREVPESGILADRTDRRDLTDANGSFRVRQASPHGYLLSICNPEPSDPNTCKETAAGVTHVITYVGPSGVTDGWVLQTSLFPTLAGDRDVGTVVAKPQGFIHGTITGAANQSVRLLRLNNTVACYGSTDDKGRYRFQGLAPGHYRVAAGGDGWRPWLSPVVDLAASQDLAVDGALDRGATIRGLVRSAGTPVPYLDVLVRRVGGRIVAAATTDDHGVYEVSGLLPGRFQVGVSYDGSDFQRHSVAVTVAAAHAQVDAPISLVRGAVITVALRAGGAPAIRASDELRDSSGHAVLGQRNLDGRLTYPGLSAGDYTVVAANATHFAVARVHVTTARTYDLGTRVLNRPTLTLTGTTAPRGVVEAFSGNECPPDGPVRAGSFEQIERADDSGHYVIHGLVPGHYMLGVDGWPANYAPYCRSDVLITHDRRAALPLQIGSTVSGQLVYASTGTPLITTLSYQLTYPPGSPTNPTDEHPSRARSVGASGVFTVDRLAAGMVSGALSQGADSDQITSPTFLVLFPFQDFTPYYLTSRTRSVDIAAQTHVRLGRIPLSRHG